ncbi:MAG: acyltransferase [Bacteroidetes bacterium]|nr:acyltransferase [Bacteroidota bacterium]MBS1737111.1 acyltransferase [Bacteroidota bacterium]
MRVEQITFSRFIAAISIVIFHFGREVSPFNNEGISFIFRKAGVGVGYFFILSGFVMIIAYSKKPGVNAIEYFKNRVARIYPAYFLAICLLFGHLLFKKETVDTTGLIFNLLVIQSWIPSQALSFNYPGWSLAVEFFFYAIFPFLLNFIYSKKEKYRAIAIIIILFWMLCQVSFYFIESPDLHTSDSLQKHNFFYYFPFMHLNEFLVGNLAGLFFIRNYDRLTGRYDLAIAGVVICIILFLRILPMSLNVHNGLLALFFVPFIVLLSSNTGRLTKIFNRKLFVFLGEISYGLYILQIPVFRWMYSLLHFLHIENDILKFYISCIALIFLSALSYKFVETPLRHKIKNVKIFRKV